MFRLVSQEGESCSSEDFYEKINADGRNELGDHLTILWFSAFQRVERFETLNAFFTFVYAIGNCQELPLEGSPGYLKNPDRAKASASDAPPREDIDILHLIGLQNYDGCVENDFLKCNRIFHLAMQKACFGQGYAPMLPS